MSARELNVDDLIDRRVYGTDGRAIGRLEELRAERDDEGWRVVEYHVGAFALFERLGAWPLGRAVLRTLRLAKRGGGYRVPWHALDLTDPERPTLRCPVSELAPLAEDS